MNTTYIAAAAAAAFWSGRFAPVNRIEAARLGFLIGDSDVALCASDPDGLWHAIIMLGRGCMTIITEDGTVIEADLNGVLLGETHHRIVASLTSGGFRVSTEEAA